MAKSLMEEFGTDAQADRHARMTTATMYMGAFHFRAEKAVV